MVSLSIIIGGVNQSPETSLLVMDCGNCDCDTIPFSSVTIESSDQSSFTGRKRLEKESQRRLRPCR